MALGSLRTRAREHKTGLRIAAAAVSIAAVFAAVAPASAVTITRGTRSFNYYNHTMLNGMSGAGVANGNAAQTLGVAQPPISMTWVQDDCTNMTAIKAEYSNWNKPLIIAVGGLPQKSHGVPQFSWKEAAVPGGKGVQYWNRCLDAILSTWGNRSPGLLTYSFAHEPNENPNDPWYAHAVKPGQEADFLAAEKLFYQLVQQRSKGSKVMVAMNGDADAATFERLTPASQYIDFVGLTQYAIHWPQFSLANAIATSKNRGKPIMLQEWGSKAIDGDGVAFTREMRSEIANNAGRGPGQVAVAVFFNLDAGGIDNYAITTADGKKLSPNNDPAIINEVRTSLQIFQGIQKL